MQWENCKYLFFFKSSSFPYFSFQRQETDNFSVPPLVLSWPTYFLLSHLHALTPFRNPNSVIFKTSYFSSSFSFTFSSSSPSPPPPWCWSSLFFHFHSYTLLLLLSLRLISTSKISLHCSSTFTGFIVIAFLVCLYLWFIFTYN